MLTKFIFVFFTVFSALASADSFPESDRSIGEVKSYKLDNGMIVILAPDASAQTSTVVLTVKTGSRHEGYGETGMAHLLEHMLFKGAGDIGDIKAELTSLGAKWNGTTTVDRTNYFETFEYSPDKMGKVLRLESLRLSAPTFTKSDLDTEMPVVRNELERNENSPSVTISQTLSRLAWQWHGYGHPVIGERSDIENAPFYVLRNFYFKHYRPDNSILTISGKFDIELTKELINRSFSELKNPIYPAISTWTREPALSGSRSAAIHRPSATPSVAVAWRTPAFSDKDSLALDLAMDALFAVPRGPIHKQYVIRERKATAVSGGLSLMTEAGLASVYADLEKGKNTDRAVLDLATLVETTALKGLKLDDIESARQNWINTFDKMFANPERLAQLLSDSEVQGDWRLLSHMRDNVSSISTGAVNSALAKWLIPDNRVSVTFDPSRKSTALPIPAPELPSPEVLSSIRSTIIFKSDPIVIDKTELDKSSTFTSPAPNLKVGILRRRNPGNLVYVRLENDFGDEKSLYGHKQDCTYAQNLIGISGAGYNPTSLADKLTSLNATINVSLNGLSVTAPASSIKESLALAFSLRDDPTFPKSEVDRIRERMISETSNSMFNPNAVVSSRIEQETSVFPKNHWNRDFSLSEQMDLSKKLSVDAAKKCIAEFFPLNIVRVSAVGDVPEDFVHELSDLVSRSRKTHPSRHSYERIVNRLDKSGPFEFFDHVADKPNTILVGTLPLPIRDTDPDYVPLMVAINVLGGNAQSRLWKALREDGGVSYSVNSSLSGNQDAAANVRVVAISANQNAQKALLLLKQTVEGMSIQQVSPTEVEKSISALLEMRKHNLSEPANLGFFLQSKMFMNRGFEWSRELDSKISKVSASDVNRVISDYLKTQSFSWFISGGGENPFK